MGTKLGGEDSGALKTIGAGAKDGELGTAGSGAIGIVIINMVSVVIGGNEYLHEYNVNTYLFDISRKTPLDILKSRCPSKYPSLSGWTS